MVRRITIAISLGLFCLVESQRSPYAGSANRYPMVLPQYLNNGSGSNVPVNTVAVSGVAANPVNSATVVNRLDGQIENNLAAGTAGGARPAIISSTIPPYIPVDALGDINLIERIKTWPREKQPFWYINWQQIQAHRGDSSGTANNNSNVVQPVQPQPNNRSPFAG